MDDETTIQFLARLIKTIMHVGWQQRMPKPDYDRLNRIVLGHENEPKEENKDMVE